MIGTITFNADSHVGSLTFGFDSATAPVAQPCGAACTLLDFSFQNVDESMITGFDLVFDPATVVKSWSATAFHDGTSPAPLGGIQGTRISFTYTGSDDHSFSTTSAGSAFATVPCNPRQDGCFIQITPQLPTFTFKGSWSASVANLPAPVPEPGSAALALLGLGAMVRRRR
jgi:hypothetical protein